MSEPLECPVCRENNWVELAKVLRTDQVTVLLDDAGLIRIEHNGQDSYEADALETIGLACASCDFRIDGDAEVLSEEEVSAVMFPVPDLEALLALRKRLQR